ncbi:glutathione S-transferase family protein [Oricola sp.]|uniref:glutathione S-transferase family protein n=1 Tax=Oricola sp. TaxID=1979950 RepID=UPI0025F7555C|nr:glutathione S-transferase family protein [Oricola sp.]MCI5075699.1 glutathione S-transferase family protein [Oricola sp.]
MRIVIGNKAYSSWSMRAWLVLKAFGIPFEETVIPLYRPESQGLIARYSRAGKVPVLIDGDVTLWESLAIIEHLAETRPDLAIWPADPAARAHARSIAAEMHAGFAGLRSACPMSFVARYAPRDRGEDCAADVARLCAVWEEARSRFGADGPYLYGTFSAADAMYAPLAGRLFAYQIDVPETARSYMDAVMAHPAYRDWVDAGLREPWVIEEIGVGETVVEDYRAAEAP